MQVKLNEFCSAEPEVTLTDESSASSYGQPVAIIGGQVYGAEDLVGGRGHAGPLVMAMAVTARLHGKITTEQLDWCARFWK